MAMKNTQRGFALLIAIIFMSVMLTFGLVLSSLAYKQQVLASSAVESQYAFYVSDAALECALYADQQMNAFDYSSHSAINHPSTITCNGASATELSYSYDATALVVKERLSFDPVSGPGARCADVTVYKYSAPQPPDNMTSYLFSQGYDVSCATVSSPSGARLVSRGLNVHYSGSVQAPLPSGMNVEYLVVAGGGGGSSTARGGGGAGGMLTASGFPVVTGTPITVTVGAGGAVGNPIGTKGGDSSFDSITATGGGYGAADVNAGDGGSGGGQGSGSVSTGSPGHGIAGQGSNGNGGGGNSYGGGGGAGGSPAALWAGGVGLSSSISGVAITYAVGGPPSGSTGTTPGSGGNNIAGTSKGGIVIIRYPDTDPAAASTTGSPTITVTGGYRIYSWTASGSITF